MPANSSLRALAGTATLALVCVTLAAGAAAQNRSATVTAPSGDQMTERVSYRDLNLAIKADEKTLFRRVGGAVHRICYRINGGVSATSEEHMSCSSDAWAGARPQIRTAVRRAQEIALTGNSTIAAAAITISFR